MEDYRRKIKEHFESLPQFAGMVASDYLFWGIGLAVYILGGLLSFANGAGIAAGILEPVGLWVLYFGIVLAFIKKDDIGLMISLGSVAVYNLVLFIVLLAAFRAAPIGQIINFIVYGLLFFFAWKASSAKQQSDIKRAQQSGAAAICPTCGAAIPQGAAFCQVCGAKAPQAPRCPRCGEMLAPGAGFCPKCGAKLGDTAAGSICPACRAAVGPDDVFCPVCGTKLK